MANTQYAELSPIQEAIRRLTSPEDYPPLPLMELSRTLNPFYDQGVKVYFQLMTFMPLGTVKAGPAFEMLWRRQLAGIHTIVEASSGNTGAALAALAPQFGIKHTIILIPPGTPEVKKQRITKYGAIVEEVTNGMQKAKEMGERPGFLNPDQYGNPDSLRFFERVTGPQIWEQTTGKVSLFVAAVGSGSTITGTSFYLKRQNPRIQTLGVIVAKDNVVSGARTLLQLKHVRQPWQAAVDRTQEVGAEASYRLSHKLIRDDIVVGPSSGMALEGLFQELRTASAQQLNKFRNEDGEIVAVVIAPDGPQPYLDTYKELGLL